MDEINDRIIEIIYKKINDKMLDPVETRELQEWVELSRHNRELLGRFEDDEWVRQESKKMSAGNLKSDWLNFTQKYLPSAGASVLPMTQRIKQRRFYFAAAAAAMVIITVGGFWMKSRISRTDTAQTENQYRDDIGPGGEKATLTLADGTRISLDSAADGSLALQGNTNIVKLHAGSLAYKSAKAGRSGEVLWNTITIPRGGQYRLILPDGSRVWLNAASSLRFPNTFVGKERIVELQGEGYFEVVKNTAQPFKVYADKPMPGGQTRRVAVEVLGTSFNVMAYNDEELIKTTLVEGSVRLSSGNASKMLKPGQQFGASNTGELYAVPDVDIESEIAWKQGLFKFSRVRIEQVMNQVARWYDAEIYFEGPVTDVTFVAEIKRSENVSALLQLLEMTGRVRFRIEGKKIFVQNTNPTNT